jgi:hypothetical protein
VLRETTARDLARTLNLEFEPDDMPVLAPLVDASLVWLDDEARTPIAAPVVEALWPRELREDIERGLHEAAELSDRVRASLSDALTDLDAGPLDSRLARAVVDQAADEAAHDLQVPICCVLCFEEGLARLEAEDRRTRAVEFARLAGHAAQVPEDDVRAAVAAAAVRGEPAAAALGTRERRLAIRTWLGRIAELARDSLPVTAAALDELLAEPLPDAAADDELWREAVAGLASRLRGGWN